MATAAKVKKDPIFLYEGKTKQGKSIKGEMSGKTQAIVKSQLRKQGINANKVKKKPKPLFESKKAIKPQDVAIFTRQMATMMKAGVPLVQSFGLVADGVDNPTMRNMVNDIQDHVSGGGSFASALEKYPRIFDDLFCSLISSGEESGALEEMLDRVATYKEKTELLKKKIKKALTYPIAVIVVAIVVTGILLIKVVPQFASTFSGFGAELPAFTLFVLNLSELVQEWWWIIGGCMIGGLWVFKEMRLRSQTFSDVVDKYMLKIPVIGDILEKSVLARFARTLSTTFAAGVPLVDALESVAGAAGNALYRDAIQNVKNDVTGGVQIATSLKAQDIFPVLLIQMVSIGEESGALDDMLEKVATHYEAEVDNAVDNLTALLEPMIMSILGVLVGGLLVAMYLPIFSLGQVV